MFFYDGKIFGTLMKILQCMCLAGMWFLSSIPIVTIGASTTALYYTLNKVVRYNHGYMWSEYWSAWKANLKQATLAQLFLILLYGIGIVDYCILYELIGKTAIGEIILTALVILFLFFAVWATYLFAYIGRFENSVKDSMKNCFLILLANFPWSLLILSIVFIVGFIIYISPLLFVFIPIIYTIITNLIVQRIFRKYMTQEDLSKDNEIRYSIRK